jgi:nitroreductase
MSHYPKEIASTSRHPDHDVSKLFIERWSSRAFDSDAALEPVTLMTILEAARWAPSASNLQPWRFVYGVRGTPAFDKLLNLLVPFNQGWAWNAGALVFIASVTTYDGERPVATHSFDAGAAWMSIALQAYKLGVVSHAMAGFDADKAPEELGFTGNFKVEAVVALGYPGDVSVLPEGLQGRETPSGRMPLSEIAFDGIFHGPLVIPG